MEESGNIRIVTEWVEALNVHDLDRLAPLYDAAYRGRDISRNLDFRGFGEARSDLEQWMSAFPDLRMEIDRVVDSPHTVCLCWTFSGTHTRSFLRIPPTHRRLSVVGFSLLDLQDGRLTGGVHLWDLSGMLRSMRLLPELPSAGSG